MLAALFGLFACRAIADKRVICRHDDLRWNLESLSTAERPQKNEI